MGWASGTEIAAVIEELLLKYVPKNKLKKEAKKILETLTDMDWDCVEEVEIFDYLQKQEMLKEDGDLLEEYEVEEFKEDIEEYKKKFGF